MNSDPLTVNDGIAGGLSLSLSPTLSPSSDGGNGCVYSTFQTAKCDMTSLMRAFSSVIHSNSTANNKQTSKATS